MEVTKVRSSLKGVYTVDNSSRNHTWISDEPEEVGGENKGPKPTELLLSALASCKIITVKMYASRKNWPLDDIQVELEILEVGTPTIIQKKIEFIGNLDETQKQRLLEISGRCPVAKMVSSSITFKIV